MKVWVVQEWDFTAWEWSIVKVCSSLEGAETFLQATRFKDHKSDDLQISEWEVDK